MNSENRPEPEKAPIPGRTDAVVVGAGIVGVCTALYLQRSGRNVVLIERDRPGDSASGHNGGVFNVGECVPTGTPGVLRSIPRMLVDPMSPLVISYAYLPRLAPWLARFILASRPSRVEQISVAIKCLTDRAMEGYRPLLTGSAAEHLVHEGGVLYAYCSDEAFAADKFALDLRRRLGSEFRVLDNAAIGALDPALADRFRHAVHRPTARFTPDPQEFTKALAAQFEAAGGTLLHTTAKGFERRNGHVESVVTTNGRIRTDAIVIAAGAWSRPLVQQLGLNVPLDTERGYGVHLPNPGITFKLPVVIQDYHLAIRQTPTGVQLAGVDELAGVAAPPRYRLAERMIRAAKIVFPELQTDGGTRWMHCRPSTPDSLPVIGAVPQCSNAYVAFGHGHKGLALGAITGRLVSELIDGKDTSVNLEPYSPARFFPRHRERRR